MSIKIIKKIIGKEITEDKKKKVFEVIEAGEKVLSDQKERIEKLFKKT